MKKILFITTHNFVTNPRLVKEIRLAITNNFKVEVICFEFNNWSYEFNQQIKKEFTEASVLLHVLQAGRKPFTQWSRSVISEKTARLLSHFLPVNKYILANAVSRRSSLMLAVLKKIENTDWVIGHNPGALWATLYAGKRLKSKMGFDVEDYHPGEGNDVHLQGLTKKLMQQVLPKMDYVSFAAPLIIEEVKKDLNGNDANWFTVLNYFPAEEFATPERVISGPLKLVWFSQNINFGRGLELMLPAVKSNSVKMELHLYGNVNEDFKKKNLNGINNIFLHGALPQKQLHLELSLYDVGLALEPAGDKNNDLAVSNKLLAYLQAGLYVMASKTLGQQNFLSNFQDDCIVTDILIGGNSIVALDQLIVRKEQIRERRRLRFLKFKERCWEVESKKLSKTWEQITTYGT